jgi:hypothetical protein
MKTRVSPKPDVFGGPHEEHYWHMAQDIAFRAGAALLQETDSTWLAFPDDRQFVVTPDDPDRIWFETWLVLHRKYEGLSRLWVGGRPLNNTR